jgi:hypothetical protein
MIYVVDDSQLAAAWAAVTILGQRVALIRRSADCEALRAEVEEHMLAQQARIPSPRPPSSGQLSIASMPGIASM